MPNDPHITIAIPTYNRADRLKITLESLAHLRIPAGIRVEALVVNNASTDATESVVTEWAAKFPFPLRMVLESQQGLSFSRNRALNDSSAEHVIFFDDDVRIAPDWVIAYCESSDRFDAAAVVGPVYPEFEIPPPSHYSEQVLASVTSAYSLKGDKAFVLPPDIAHQIPGCNFAVRRKVALELGGFDTQLGRVGRRMLGYEDWEFGYALVRTGKRVVYEPRCRIEHWIPAAKIQPTSLRARWYGFGASERVLAERHGKRLPPLSGLRSAWRAARYFARSLAKKLEGDQRSSFEWELKAVREWGYATGLKRSFPIIGPRS